LPASFGALAKLLATIKSRKLTFDIKLMQSQTEIINSQPQDVDLIFEFYDMAIAHQKKSV
jgi:hypothetical protein